MPRSARRRSQAAPEQLEYLGTLIKVVASAHAPYLRIAGLVVDETRNTFLVETDDGVVALPKVGQMFAVTFADGETREIEGRAVRYRPEDRIKKTR